MYMNDLIVYSNIIKLDQVITLILFGRIVSCEYQGIRMRIKCV